MTNYNHLVDIVTVHYYNDGSDPVQWVDQFMNDRVAPYRYGKDVWMTETGRSTCAPNSESSQNSHYQGVLERWQPLRWWWRKTFFYHLYDGAGCSDAIVRPNQTNRPAFDTYRNFIILWP
jgi:hypothetical protein